MSLSVVRPLLMTSDQGLLDAVVSIAGEAQVELAVSADAGAASSLWAAAPLVLLGADQVEGVGRLGLPARPGLVVVSRGIDDVTVWRELMATGAEHVVELPEGAPRLYERLRRTLAAEPNGRVVAVVGSVGGAGTSTLAVAMARQAVADGDPATVVDLDPHGGGLDLMLGAEHDRGARWDELAGVTGRVDERALMEALPTAGGLRVLSWRAPDTSEPDAPAVAHVVEALARGPGVVVVDAGRATDPRALTAVMQAAVAVVVVPMRVRAVAAARLALSRLPQHVTPVLVARGPAPGGLTVADIGSAVGLAVSGTLEEDRRRPTAEEMGGPPPDSAMWRRVCRKLLAEHRGAAA